MDGNTNKRRRSNRRVKLGLNQRKNLDQHSHSRHRRTEGDRRCMKRKLENDIEEEIPKKLEVKDISELSDENIVKFSECDKDIEDFNESVENMEGAKINDAEYDVKSNSFHYEEEKSCPPDLEAVNINQLPVHLNYALQTLKDENLLIPLITKLDRVHAVKDYILQARLLANGRLPVDNIPFLLSLERAKFAHVTTTTLMRFRPETKAFFRVGYRTWHGKGMLLLSGSKNRGQVRSHFTKRGYYDPAEASVNFAVPDIKTLFGKDCGIPKFINPGIIQDSFELIDKSKQYVLAYDLKKVGRGFKKDMGDEDMWGFEGPPSLQESLKRIEEEKLIVENLSRMCDEENMPEMAKKCKELLITMVNRMNEIREVELGHRRLLAKLNDPNNKPNYNTEYLVSFCKTQIYSCMNWLQNSIMCNRHITHSLSMMNDTIDYYQDRDRVDMNTQTNFDILFPPTMMKETFDIDNNPEIVKQRSARWHDLRKKSRLTGSTCYKGLGFGLLREAKEHFDTFVLKKPEPKVSEELQKIFDYGTANEINGLAAVATVFMPALLPPCMQLVEDGCTFLHGSVIQNLLEVSSDGIIECQHNFNGRPCNSYIQSSHHKIIVEVKCVVPKEFKSPVRYHIPPYHATQLLCEMKANEATEAWYVVYSEKSTVLIGLKFSTRIWNQLWRIIKDTFDLHNPCRPTKLNKAHDDFKEVLKTYAQTHSKVLAEVGSMKSMPLGNLNNCTVLSPYRSVYTCRNSQCEFVSIKESCELVAFLTMPLFKEAHEIQRKRASEIMAFVISDSDREYNKKMPANNPIAYALKGSSLNMQTTRSMVEIVRNKCKEENIEILTEVFDGQFSNIACRSIEGEPLTILKWQKDNWNHFIGMSKNKLLRYVQDISYVPPEDIKHLQEEEFNPFARTIIHGNLQLDLTYILRGTKILRKYYLQGRGGPQYNYSGPTMKHVHTKKKYKHKTVDPVWDYFMPKKKDMSKKELNVDYVMELMACEEFPNALDVVQSMEDQFTQVSSNCETFDKNSKTLLQEILLKLQKLKSKHDWKSVSITEFYVTKLATAQSIAENFFSYEMDVIAECLARKTETQLLFRKNTDKATKVNILSKYFGDQSVWNEPPKRYTKHVMITLKKCALQELERSSYPKSLLASAAATVRHHVEFNEWELSHNLPKSVNISCIGRSFNYFNYPEFSKCRNQFESRTFDPTHILTNLRAHISRSGFQHVRSDAFKEVSERDNNLLSRAIVFDCIDKQNCEIALQFFSEEVENDIRKHGDNKTAKLVKLVRNWYLASDERGIPIQTRLNSLLDMHDYMMQFYNAAMYPPPTTHVYGLPLQTFEALLQSISTRIRLYSFAHGHKFNHRSVSSLGVESFFSDLSVVEISGTGCPKAYQIPKLISIITEYNTAKHNPAKLFNIDPRRGVKYPARLLDTNSSSSSDDEEEPQNLNNQFKAHSFDRMPRFTKKRKKFRVSVSAPTQSSRGEQPIRVVGKYKLNEAKLSSCTRMGLPDDIKIQ